MHVWQRALVRQSSCISWNSCNYGWYTRRLQRLWGLISELLDHHQRNACLYMHILQCIE